MEKKRDIYLPIVPKFKTIQKEPKRAEMKKCNSKLITTIRDKLSLNHVHNQATFGKHVINARVFIYLGSLEMVFTF